MGRGVAALRPDGEIRAGGSSLPTDFTYTGQRSEASLGLLDYRARMYDPLLARFLSADTVVPQPGNPQALNRYSYVGNNALKNVDPAGHCSYNVITGQLDCSGINTLTVNGNLTGVPTFTNLRPSGPAIQADYGNGQNLEHYMPRDDDGVILVYTTGGSGELQQEWVLMHGEADFGVGTGFAEVRSVRITPLWGDGEAKSFDEWVVGGGPGPAVPIIGKAGLQGEYGSVSGFEGSVSGNLFGGELEFSPGSVKLGFVPEVGPGARVGLGIQGGSQQWFLTSYGYLNQTGLDAFGKQNAPGAELTYSSTVYGYCWESWGRRRYTTGLTAARYELYFLKIPYEEVP